MNAKYILAIAALTIVSGSVFAQTSTAIAARDQANASVRNNYPVVPFVASKTRAEVINELKQAQAQGLITNGNDYPIVRIAPSHKVRGEVQVDTARANDNGNTNLYSGA
ncbi:DUF4148 domain-containing protein [Herbaspirillum sp. RV1423]|uniref:DUF4148 domain-containing protein n=1 Tax=Herbaspirillum sp. RV1423 TaxID=1443993 RepID=UPI0004B2C50E|nr:DUF4148 domain-containing protein [Herbaspirillum sp. RV1423]